MTAKARFVGCVACGEPATTVDVASENDGDQITSGYCDTHVDDPFYKYEGRKLRKATDEEREPDPDPTVGQPFGIGGQMLAERRNVQAEEARAALVADVKAEVLAELNGDD